MAHSHFIPYMDSQVCRKMDRDIVLDVGALANTDFGQVSTDYRIVENGGIVTDFHITNKAGPFGKEHSFAKNRLLALVFDYARHNYFKVP